MNSQFTYPVTHIAQAINSQQINIAYVITIIVRTITQVVASIRTVTRSLCKLGSYTHVLFYHTYLV
ncbi:hypothetical protein HanLR1_Chr12g0429991 [Helianthus annuus]|nr:hypothetical protein HanLR1_Chr12g0429991 [Helianthus annuus]